MRKVLMIANQFPPLGGSGVQRTTKFVKYLRDFNWEPIVLTRKSKGMSLKDNTLLKDIPEDTNIIRTNSLDPTELPGVLKYLGKLIGRKLLIPDAERIWQLFSFKAAVKCIDENSIDVIYTTSYPFSDHLMGLALKKQFPGITWVADFRDEWTNNPYVIENNYSKRRRLIEKRMENEVLEQADHIIANTPVMKNNFVRISDVSSEKFSVIPNGFDSDDFADIESDLSADNKRSMSITYTGLLYGRRKPDTFFEAVRIMIDKGDASKDELAINFIGNYKTDEFNKKISSYGLDGVVKLLPYMEHKKCLAKLLQSDVLLLIESSEPGGDAFYTGKLFEYINAGRPILAVVPDYGAAADLVRETKTGHVSDYGNVDEIYTILKKIFLQWKKGCVEYNPRKDIISGYERKDLTCKLAEIFNKLTS